MPIYIQLLMWATSGYFDCFIQGDEIYGHAADLEAHVNDLLLAEGLQRQVLALMLHQHHLPKGP